MNFIRRRLCERSTYAHLVTCLCAVAGVAFGVPGWMIWGLVALSVVGAIVPDGSVKPQT